MLYYISFTRSATPEKRFFESDWGFLWGLLKYQSFQFDLSDFHAEISQQYGCVVINVGNMHSAIVEKMKTEYNGLAVEP